MLIRRYENIFNREKGSYTKKKKKKKKEEEEEGPLDPVVHIMST